MRRTSRILNFKVHISLLWQTIWYQNNISSTLYTYENSIDFNIYHLLFGWLFFFLAWSDREFELQGFQTQVHTTRSQTLGHVAYPVLFCGKIMPLYNMKHGIENNREKQYDDFNTKGKNYCHKQSECRVTQTTPKVVMKISVQHTF